MAAVGGASGIGISGSGTDGGSAGGGVSLIPRDGRAQTARALPGRA